MAAIPLQEPSMATVTGAKPHPIFLAGKWVESPDPLVISNPANPDQPAGATFHATPEQYEEAVTAAVAAFETTRNLPAYEPPPPPPRHAPRTLPPTTSAGTRPPREELGRSTPRAPAKPIPDSLVE